MLPYVTHHIREMNVRMCWNALKIVWVFAMVILAIVDQISKERIVTMMSANVKTLRHV